jgi:hypothetical protein
LAFAARHLECAMSCVKSQYDGFIHFVHSVGACQQTLIPMFTLYCDDSGTHSQSEIAVAACYIAPVSQWDKFTDEWNRANDIEHFGVFHMADFVAKQEQFAKPEWADKQKRDRAIKRLINIIQTRAQFAISCAVEKAAYDETAAENSDHAFWRAHKNHYTFAIRHCISYVEKWRRKYKYRDPIQYVFDRLSKGKGEINRQMELAASGKEAALRVYGIQKDGWSFQDKSVVIQLQAADIWAWENYKYTIDSFLPAKEYREPARQSFRALQRVPHVIRLHNRATLIELAKRMRADPRT